MYWILYLYIIVVLLFGFKISKVNTLYIYSPFIVIYVQFAVMDVVPLLMNINDSYIPNNLLFVTTSTAIINMIMILIYHNDLTRINNVTIPNNFNRFNSIRNKLYYVFWGIMITLGIITGTTIGLLHGVDVENTRRTSEVGIGFIRDIPYLGLPFLLLTMLLVDEKIGVIKSGAKSLMYGLFHFLSTAGRAGILQGFNVFLAWFGLKRRTLNFLEYIIIFYLIGPIFAILLIMVRRGDINFNLSNGLFAHQNMVFNYNTLPMMDYTGDSNFLYGYSYYYSFVKLIPRFIWPAKPVAVDYYYKEMLSLDFDGGGIYTTVPNEFFMNFGYYYMIPYVFWILILHYMYKQLLKKQDYVVQLLCMVFLMFYNTPSTAIGGIQIFLLFVIVCRFVYNRFKVI